MIQEQKNETYDQFVNIEGLKPISRFDEIYPDDEEEYQAYWDFIHWSMMREHAILLIIPKSENQNEFWQSNIDEFGTDTSAFNTIDYQRDHRDGFDKYQYRCKKIFEKVKDLALLYSCLTTEDGKQNIFNRYVSLVENEFSDPAKSMLQTYKNNPHIKNKDKVVERIKELNRRIRKCKQIWQKYMQME